MPAPKSDVNFRVLQGFFTLDTDRQNTPHPNALGFGQAMTHDGIGQSDGRYF